MWLKTPTASQNIFNCVLFFCIKLWTFVKQPEEGSPAAHWESSSWPEVHQLSLLLANRRVSCAILLIIPLLTSEHWGQIPFRWHANYVPVRLWSHPIIFHIIGDFSTDRFHPQIFIQCQETLMISHISSLWVCVCGREADGSAVWCLEGCMEMLAESCWFPACIHHSTSLSIFPSLLFV